MSRKGREFPPFLMCVTGAFPIRRALRGALPPARRAHISAFARGTRAQLPELQGAAPSGV